MRTSPEPMGILERGDISYQGQSRDFLSSISNLLPLLPPTTHPPPAPSHFSLLLHHFIFHFASKDEVNTISSQFNPSSSVVRWARDF